MGRKRKRHKRSIRQGGAGASCGLLFPLTRQAIGCSLDLWGEFLDGLDLVDVVQVYVLRDMGMSSRDAHRIMTLITNRFRDISNIISVSSDPMGLVPEYSHNLRMIGCDSVGIVRVEDWGDGLEIFIDGLDE